MTELQSGFIAEMASTLAGDGFRPYGPHRCPTTMISDCPKADFSPEKVSLTSCSLCKTLSQSSMCVATNRRHPSGPIISSFSSTGHPLIGMSSKNGMVMSGMQSLSTLFIAFTMWATEFVPPCGRVHIRTRPRGVRIVVMSLLSTASWN